MNPFYQRLRYSLPVLIYLTASVLLTNLATNAQSTSNYSFTTSASGSLTDMNSSTTTLTDNTSTEIGFEFWFMGVRCTTFTVNKWGQMSLNSYLYDAVNAPSSSKILIVPLSGSNSNTGKIHYKVAGSEPYRILIVEWKDMKVPANGADAERSTFQARLYEENGKIEFVYGQMYNCRSSDMTGIGIFISSGSTASKVGSVDAVNSTYSTAASPTVNTFTANSAMNNLNSTDDGSRRIFTFTPPAEPMGPGPISFSGVTLTDMTLNWSDESDNETGFAVYRSDDGGLTYNYMATTAAGVTTYTQTGLFPGITYHWCVSSVNEGAASAPTASSQATVAGLLGGVKTVGPSGDYVSLTAAIADIKSRGLYDHIILELQAGYSSTSETFPLTFPDMATTSATTITVRPATAAAGLAITCGDTATVVFSGGDYITIDGRPGGAGTARELSITNTRTSGDAAVTIKNSSSYNNLRYLNIKAVNPSATGGVLYLGTCALGTEKNVYNSIEYCNIDGSGKSANCIYSAGWPANSYISVLNNNIFDFYISSVSTVSTAGIYLYQNSPFWTISGNSIYQTAARTYSATASMHYGIAVQAGTGAVIENNFIGGNSANASGTWTISGGAVRFFPVYLVSDCSVQGNTIKNMNITTAYNDSYVKLIFAAVAIWNGATQFGNNSGNTIGSAEEAGNIVIRYTATVAGQYVCGIHAHNYAARNISNNTIAGITIEASAATTGVNFYGIHLEDAGATMSGNTIGSESVAGSIRNMTGSNHSSVLLTRGIFIEATDRNTMTNNTIQNITESAKYGSLTGIYDRSNYGTTDGNIIRHLSNSSARGGFDEYYPDPSIAGIVIEYYLTGSISQNRIYNLKNSSTAANLMAIGILYMGTTNPDTVLIERNLIHSLTLATASSGAYITGFYVADAGACTFRNNMIRLGLDYDGNSITNPVQIFGILKDGISKVKACYNSVYIGGSGVTGSTMTAAFRRVSIYDWEDFVYDNIFSNERSNGTGTGKHYAYIQNFTSSIKTDYNIYYASGSGGVMASVDGGVTAIESIRQLREVYSNGQELHSLQSNPNFINCAGSGTEFDLHLNTSTPAEASGSVYAGTLADFDGDIRSELTPADIGADAGSYSNYDISTPNFSYTPARDTAAAAVRTVSGVVITDFGSGVPVSGINAPRIWFKNKTKSADWASSPGTLNSGNGNEGVWSFGIDYSLSGGYPAEGDTIQYYFTAQDNAGNIWYAPFKGAEHTDVNTRLNAPDSPESYAIAEPGPVIGYVALTRTYKTGARVLGNVSITDEGGVASDPAPRVYWKVNHSGSWQHSSTASAGSPYSFDINTSGLIDGDTVYYYVLAQNASGKLSALPSDGFAAADMDNITAHPTNPNKYEINTNYGGGDLSDAEYFFANSTARAATAENQPAYEWIDPLAGGFNETIEDDWTGGPDEGYIGPLDIGFTFEFCGLPYTELYLASNGYIKIGAEPPVVNAATDGDAVIPDTLGNENIIAACMNDLDLYMTAENTPRVFYGSYGDAYVITFLYARRYGAPEKYISFQIILMPDGGVKIQYNPDESSDFQVFIDEAIIGIEDETGTKGIGYRNKGIGGPVFDGSSGLALQFGPTAALPVELSGFASVVNGSDVLLRWETKTEINSFRFDVERKFNGADGRSAGAWVRVGAVNAAGSSNSPKQYTFNETVAKAGTYSYRLRMLDNDGSAEYGPVIRAEIKPPAVFALAQNYPNPFNPVTIIRYSIPEVPAEGVHVKLIVYDILGGQAAVLVNEIQGAGNYEAALDAGKYGLSSGVYFYRLQAGQFISTKKALLLK